MNKIIAVVLISIAFSACAAEKEASGELTALEKRSYALGYRIAQRVQIDGVAMDGDAIANGVRDALSGTPPVVPQDEMVAALQTLQQEIQHKQAELRGKNEALGKAFLAENSKKEGVVSLPSGLQYVVIREGTGKQPGPTDSITAHYRGTLISGEEFDSSIARGKPATFRVNQVIQGWQEALQLMKEGSKWQLFIPSTLAYGPNAKGDVIGPNSTLIFDVELLSID